MDIINGKSTKINARDSCIPAWNNAHYSETYKIFSELKPANITASTILGCADLLEGLVKPISHYIIGHNS